MGISVSSVADCMIFTAGVAIGTMRSTPLLTSSAPIWLSVVPSAWPL